ncbi:MULTISPECIES: DUF3502 domain-containing protein [Caproicibacterium]|uniref:DUF3502 domain-containing protein n=1 Tax=Caproicibacterium argilliputei TaxID=3030016 RepID=A0AA97D6T6_9FIRM|nr:DUF3502 domain-containing protein [Caproicibacterium argilliputei]WOC31640.1 DUF3502 domain-containing protein [Caproicibacterium argilliputei]
MKNRKVQRLLAGGVAAAMLMTSAAGCGNSSSSSSGGDTPTASTTASATSSKVDTSKEVKLKMYLLGDKPADFDKVYAEINKELKAKINATVDVSFLSWAEHDQKYSLLFSSGEDFDLIFTAAGWAHYETTASKKGFYKLTDDFLNTYAPDVKKVVPEEAWKQATINGGVYMVPNYNIEFGQECVAVRGDLMKKYGFKDITSTKDLESFCDKVAKNEKNITPFGAQGKALQYTYLLNRNHWKEITGTPLTLFAFQNNDLNNTKVISVAETQQFRQYAKEMKTMQQKGYWSKDALSTKDTRSDAFLQGKAACMVWNVGSCASYSEQANKDHPDWNCNVYDLFPNDKKTINVYTNNGIAINARSKNPERAMMAIDQFMTNKKIYDLAAYGIEGEHYKAVGDKKYVTGPKADRYPANTACNWGWNNENLTRSYDLTNADPARIKAQNLTDAWKKSPAEAHPLLSFSFSEDKVKTQVSVMNTLISQYMDPICCGLVDDPDKAVDEFVAKLKQAGLDQVKAEIQRQADERVAELKKA